MRKRRLPAPQRGIPTPARGTRPGFPKTNGISPARGAPIHDRIPVIIPREDWDQWPGPGKLDDQRSARLTTPYNPCEMRATEVSRLVNSARTGIPQCCELLPTRNTPAARSTFRCV